jgi:hypothetical protein
MSDINFFNWHVNDAYRNRKESQLQLKFIQIWILF